MAYDSTKLTCMAQVAGPVGMKVWVYDTADAETTVDGAGYIDDALTRGMEKGDIVYNRRWTTSVPADTSEKTTADGVANDLISVFIHFVIGISTAGAADLTNGLAITAT